MSKRILFMTTHIEKHVEKQKDFLERRSRKRSLRSFNYFTEERKERFDAYNDYVKYNNFYMVMFLEFLQFNSQTFTFYKDEYIKKLTDLSYIVLELFEKCERESEYLDMCSIIKNDLNTAKLIHKYQK